MVYIFLFERNTKSANSYTNLSLFTIVIIQINDLSFFELSVTNLKTSNRNQQIEKYLRIFYLFEDFVLLINVNFFDNDKKKNRISVLVYPFL
jgi:hypothetical protein